MKSNIYIYLFCSHTYIKLYIMYAIYLYISLYTFTHINMCVCVCMCRHAYGISKSAIPIQLWKKHLGDIIWRTPSNLSGHHAPELSSWGSLRSFWWGDERDRTKHSLKISGVGLRSWAATQKTAQAVWYLDSILGQMVEMAKQEISGACNLDTMLFLLWFPVSVSLLRAYINFKMAYKEMGLILMFQLYVISLFISIFYWINYSSCVGWLHRGSWSEVDKSLLECLWNSKI